MNENISKKLRPSTLDEVIGQDHLTKNNGFIKKSLEQNKLFSIIFYGPSGVGKTSLAIIIAKNLNKHYRIINAASSNKKELEIIIEEAKMYGELVVIIDEIHRLNKEKQDFLLQHIESGLITIIGATTVNPFVSANNAIRSRCQILKLNSLKESDIFKILKNSLSDEKGFNNEYTCDDELLNVIAKKSKGDVRYALNSLEMCSITCNDKIISKEDVMNNLDVDNYIFDNNGDEHYNLVSAFQKSIRGSDVDASLYYLARLCKGKDLESIERRLLVIAYEDIGLGNPSAVDRTCNAIETAKKIGFPEAIIPLSFAVIDLALSPKSKSACISINKALDLVDNTNYDIPEYLKLLPLDLKEEEKYDYDLKEIWNKIGYLPKHLKDVSLYEYNESGKYEKALIENYKKYKNIEKSYDLTKVKKYFEKNNKKFEKDIDTK